MENHAKVKSNIKTKTKYKSDLIAYDASAPNEDILEASNEGKFMQNNNYMKQHDVTNGVEQQVVNIPQHAYRWLKQSASDEEDDPLTALVRSKQKAESLKWISPVKDGPSIGSIQASSQMLQEHVVLLDLEDKDISDISVKDGLSSGSIQASSQMLQEHVVLLNLEDKERSNISVMTPESWSHHSENCQLDLPVPTDSQLQQHEINDVCEGTYRPDETIQRLSPIFDESSNDKNSTPDEPSPEQIVPNSLPNEAISQVSGSSCNRPTNFQVSRKVAWCGMEAVPDKPNVLNSYEMVDEKSPGCQVSSKSKDPVKSESYYDLCFLSSDLDTDNPDSGDDLLNGVNSDVSFIQSVTTNPTDGLVPICGNDASLSNSCEDKSKQAELVLSESSAISNSTGHVGANARHNLVCSTSDSEPECDSCNISLIEQLPEELIFKILFYLSKKDLCLSIAPVSQKWRSFAYDPILWQFIDLSHMRNLDSVHLCDLLRRSSLLKSVNLPGHHDLTFMEVKVLGYYCPMLQEINLGFCRSLTGYAIQSMVTKCQALTSVNVEGCEVVDNSIAYHFTCLPELRVLNLSHCTKLTDEAVINIAVLCEKLEALNIDGIPWISDNAIRCLASERRETLEAVFLDGAELTDESIRNLTDCRKLHTMSISFCELFTDKSLTYLQKVKAPKHLRLKRGSELTGQALANLFLVDSMASLTYLNLTECSEIGDAGVVNLARMCRSLQHIALCWCWYVTDVGLEAIVDYCGCLEVLDLIGLKVIEGRCLERVPEALPQLKFIDARNCNNIHDDILIALVNVKKNLRILNYYGMEVNPDDEPEGQACEIHFESLESLMQNEHACNNDG